MSKFQFTILWVRRRCRGGREIATFRWPFQNLKSPENPSMSPPSRPAPWLCVELHAGPSALQALNGGHAIRIHPCDPRSRSTAPIMPSRSPVAALSALAVGRTLRLAQVIVFRASRGRLWPTASCNIWAWAPMPAGAPAGQQAMRQMVRADIAG